MTDEIQFVPIGYNDGLKAMVSAQRPSVSFLQRQLKVQYNRAATIMERFEANGIVSAKNQDGSRKILITAEDLPAHQRTENDGLAGGILKTTMESAMGHNSAANGPDLINTTSLSDGAREKLRQTVDRIERLEEEKKEVTEQIKDVYAEAKAMGYDTKALRQCVKLRKQDKQEREEQEQILDVYLMALGEI